MNQTDELDRVKARIRALAAKTISNGCTEAEAMSAADMVGRLLERYALSMAEIDIREAVCVQLEIPLGGQRRRPIDGCVTAIARFCDCKIWLARRPGAAHYVLFGFAPDVALGEYLFALLDRAMTNEVNAFRRASLALRGADLRLASTSFQHGMAARLAGRLEAMLRERAASMAAQRVTGTALAIVKHAVVEAAFRETSIRLVSAGGLGGRRNKAAFQHGFAAGGRVNLSRPVAGAGQRQLG